MNRTIQRIVTEAASAIAQAVRDDIAAEVARVVGSRAGLSATGHVRQRAQIFCPVQGCGKPGGGPKWGWFCAEHKNMTPAEKDRVRAARKAQRSRGGASASAAAAAPSPNGAKARRKK